MAFQIGQREPLNIYDERSIKRVAAVTLDMMAECVDESGRPAVLIRADTRLTITKVEMKPGDEKPTLKETFDDNFNKTIMISKGVGLAFAGEPSMAYLAAEVISEFTDRFEREGITNELSVSMRESLAFAAQLRASSPGLSHPADMLIGIRTVDGRVGMLFVSVATPGISYDSTYLDRAVVNVQKLASPFAIGLGAEPKMVLARACNDWFGGSTAGHGMAVVGAMFEDIIRYELAHNPDSKHINDRATYLLVSRDGVRQLGAEEVAPFREAHERIANSRLGRRAAVTEYEKAIAYGKGDAGRRSIARNPS